MNGTTETAGKLSARQQELLQRLVAEKRRQTVRERQIPRRGPAAHHPLSFAQQRLWFLQELMPESPYYNMPRAIRFTGRLAPAVLVRALSELVRRHESLRTAFAVVDGEPAQIVAESLTLTVPVVDVGALPGDEALHAVERIGLAFVRQPFDLGRGPLLRYVLVRLGADDHVLLQSIHHIVFDGWSQMVLAREVVAIYEAFAEGRETPLPELPVQYADFAVWQRGWLTEEVLARQLEFWLRHLEGAPPLLELPADRPRPPVQTLAGSHRYFRLDEGLSRELRAFAERRGASLYMVLVTAFRALVSRLTGRLDLVLGSPIANRHNKELEGLIGFFVNMLVMRTDLSGDPSFGTLFERVREVTLAGYENQDLPFERLVEAKKPERSLSSTPLFQVMFNLLNFPVAPHRLPGLVVDPWQLGTGTSKYDLSLYFFGGDEALGGFFEYSTDLFDPETIERLLRQLEQILAAGVADEGLRLSELPLLSEGERRQLLARGRGGEAPVPAAGLAALFEAQVRERPEALALVASGTTLTYAELDRRAEAWAALLERRGVGPEEIVGLYLGRSADLLAGLLAVQKAGGAYLPLDPSYPEQRLAFMLEDARPRVVLADRPLALPAGTGLLRMDEESPAPAPARPPRPPADLAYVIYTSGSTGRPKGVAVRQSSVVTFLEAMARRTGLGPGDTLLAVTTVSFDIAALELFLPLVTGATVALASEEEAADAGLLRRRLEGSGITAMQATPITWSLLLEAGWPGSPGLRILCGGEALPRPLADRLRASGRAVWNLYGPTETTIWSAAHPVGDGDGPVPLGVPIEGTTLSVVDRWGELAPPGVPGELWIGGAGVARGYLGRPGLTAERFVPDPFGGEPGARLYRTGDLVRLRPSGSLEFLGRVDHQVKVHGFRIELGEVEAALARIPGVEGAVVLAERGSGAGDRLVAYVAAAGLPPEEELRRLLGERLPAYMIPASFAVLERFPRTPSGKVDRARLPAAHGRQVGLGAVSRPPRSPLEKHLAALWSEVLHRPEIGVGDRFFDLGGNSIQAAVFTNRLQRDLGETVHVTALFTAQTIHELVAFLELHYPAGLARLRERLGDGTGPAGAGGGVAAGKGIGPFDLLNLRRLIAQASARRSTGRHPGAKLPGAVFVLSPPRSGSTLLRVMLAGQPRLFSPPELELLAYETLGQRAADLSGRHAFAREGLLRAVMELRGVDAEAARALLAPLEERDLPVEELYRLLQEWSGGRTLVDKTTTYAFDPRTLARAEELFSGARYIHLVRHPAATVRSYVDVHLEQFLRLDTPFSARQQAELLWTVGHQNILRFLAGVPAGRQLRLRFEDLLAAPEERLREVCDWLEVPFDEQMLRPYEGRKMTDGLHAESRLHGDPRFHEHRGIDPAVAGRWKEGVRLADLAAITRQQMAAFGYPGDEAGPAAFPAAERSPGALLPLSFTQERLWIVQQIEPESPAYHVPAAVRLDGRLDLPSLRSALGEVLRRHEILRASFPAEAGRAGQRIEPEVRLPLPVADLSALPGGARDGEAAALAAREVRRLFDLGRAPLLRATLVRLGGEEHVLLLTLHHILCDGWSLGVLLEEVAVLYEAARLGAPSPLPELPLQFPDYALWQRQWLASDARAVALGAWRERLAGQSGVLNLPTDRPRPAEGTFSGARERVELPAPLVAGLRELGSGSGATLFVTLMASLQALLGRFAGQSDVAVGTAVANRHREELEPLIGPFMNLLVIASRIDGRTLVPAWLAEVRDTVLAALAHQDLPFELLVEEIAPRRDLARHPLFQVLFLFQNTPAPEFELPELRLRSLDVPTTTSRFDLTLTLMERGGGVVGSIEYSSGLFDRATVVRLLLAWQTQLAGLVRDPRRPLEDLPLLPEPVRHQILLDWNDTRGPLPEGGLLSGFAGRATRAPREIALVAGGEEITAGELASRVERLARALRAAGCGPETLVGLHLHRSPDLVVSLLAVLRAGGAYLPLDPAYPPERLELMLEDSGARLLLTEGALSGRLRAAGCRELLVERLAAVAPERAAGGPLPDPGPEAMAYLLYTSGSTGRPKGVMVSRRNLENFFAGMDRVIPEPPGTWLAVTSVSFDISALELLWTLDRGARLVLRREAAGAAQAPAAPAPARPVSFSLAYFASHANDSADPYELLLEGARFADCHGFEAVWTPERHFHAFGGLFPNPSLLSAAIAAVTERVRIRAGSVVLPLHHPVRVAEEWSVVDNLSRGRVGVSIASGWHANDFVLAEPGTYADRKAVMMRDLETVRALWRGEAVTLPNGVGEPVPTRIFPRPVQAELPLWLTSSGSPETFRAAGEAGLRLLTHLLGQSVEDLAQKIDLYRQASLAHGHGPGHVTLMIHTFVGDELEAVREAVRGPFCSYLESSAGLIQELARGMGADVDSEQPEAAEMQRFLGRVFDRYFAGGSLMGTPETCLPMVARLAEAGVDELACLIDFGVPTAEALAGLSRLAEVERRWREAQAGRPLPGPEEPEEEPLAAQLVRHGVTHFQCTPSMARVLSLDPEAGPALAGLRCLLVGGEALPAGQAEELLGRVGGELRNVYGPTETTVWSASHRVRGGEHPVPIGRPLHNTEMYVLDPQGAPVPVGAAGEVFLGGLGVARGYLGRPDLTALRFLPDPWGPSPGARLYRTGDLARARPDGAVEFLGRVDHQVKLRGHRIELGEIEAALERHPGVREAVVLAEAAASGEVQLVAYFVPGRSPQPLRFDPEHAERVLAGRPRFRLPNGLTLAHLSDFQASNMYREVFEQRIYLRHGITLSDGDTVFDVGANVGTFTLFANHHCHRPKVFAFEPMPRTFDMLRTNVELYGLDVELFNLGVAEAPGEATFTFYPRMPGMSGRFASMEHDKRETASIVRSWLHQGASEAVRAIVDEEELSTYLDEQFESEQVVCRLTPLSRVIAEHRVERIDLLKIDVERSEVHVLRGLGDADWEKVRQVVLEVHDEELLRECREILAGQGFALAVDDHVVVEEADGAGARVTMLYAWRPESRRAEVEGGWEELAGFLRRVLPGPMVPSAFVELEALPRTPNGKVDRRALAATGPAVRAVAERPPIVPPGSELEQRIAEVFREVLRVEALGVHDNFFDLGGNSILIVEANSRLRQVLDRKIPVVKMFRNPTVHLLARHLASEQEDRSAVSAGQDRAAARLESMRQRTQRRRPGSPRTQEEAS
ncbi:MAG TPA: amino acid adenylation domain-containing protein [Thermoanaerobaculia bacterium]|nr:amino acid adenylation domain-containing protein [Thermoanaerobaculia bacterium]